MSTVFAQGASGTVLDAARSPTNRDEARAILAEIAESSDDAITGESLDGVVMAWNAGAERLFGYTPAEMVGTRVTRIVAADRAAERAAAIRRIRAGERVPPLRTTGVRKDGSRVALAVSLSSLKDAAGRIRGISAIAREVSSDRRSAGSQSEALAHLVEERRRMEAQLAAENRILEMIATGVGQERLLATMCDAIEGLIEGTRCAIRIARMRDAFEPPNASDSGPSARVGLDVFGAIAEHSVHPPLVDARAVVPSVAPDDADLIGQGIRSYWLEPIVAPGGQVVGTLGLYGREAHAPDPHALSIGAMAARLAGIVVERARADARARQQLAQLAHVARLATMGEMASGLAHELNQPLCAIVNFTEACIELVQRNGDNPGMLCQSLSEVSRQASRAGAVIRKLREFVKRREPERRAVDINEIVHDVIALTGVETRHSEVHVRVKLAKALPRVFADSIQIEQVLVNLVRNACEAMQEGRRGTRVLVIESVRHKGAVEVRVGDNGPGMPEAVQARLFEPFFTTKTNGMGMGLSITRSILEVHDGRLWITSNHKGGTTFHFTIPTAWRARRGHRHRIRRR